MPAWATPAQNVKGKAAHFCGRPRIFELKIKTKLYLLIVVSVLIGNQPLSADETLIREFEPILFFDARDEYLPTNVEPYLRASSLWFNAGEDHPDEEVILEGTLTLERLQDAVFELGDDASQTYPHFVGEAYVEALRTLGGAFPSWGFQQNLNQFALNKYQQNIVGAAIHRINYYARQVFTDEYLVLQYWFSYAYNSHGAHINPGNVHEGDWEPVTLFLDPIYREAIHVAYSSHGNRGPKVRKGWDEVEKVGSLPIVYVALGSHANYFQLGQHEALGGFHSI